MKPFERLFYVLAICAVVFFWREGCGNAAISEPIKIEVPQKLGNFKEVKPDTVVTKDTLYLTEFKGYSVKTKNPVNDSLATLYKNALDSLDKFKMYLQAIQIGSFEKTFEDSLVSIKVFGKVQGEVKEIGSDYTIKSRTILHTPRRTLLKVRGGFQMQNNLSFNNFTYNFNLGLENEKGRIIRAGYGKIGQETYFMAGVDVILFQVKRRNR
jgi:hypothetical protein